MDQPKQTPDLTTPEAIAIGEDVYDRMVAGQVQNVTAELDAAYGRGERG